MKTKLTLTLFALSAVSLMAQTTNDLIAAGKQLAQSGYAFRWTPTFGDNEEVTPTPITGQCRSNFVRMVSVFNGRTNQLIGRRGELAVESGAGWKARSEVQPGEFTQTFSRWASAIKIPEDEVQWLAANSISQNLDLSLGVFTVPLTEDAARSVLAQNFGVTRGRPAWSITNAVAVAKITMANGRITSYQVKALGEAGKQLRREWTVTISEIGTTRITVPTDADRKLRQR